MDLNRIISEQINRLVCERKMQMTSREDFEERTKKARKRDGNVISTADSEDVIEFLDSPYIVAGAVVQKATGISDTGAASVASKIINGERKVTQKLRNTVTNIKGELSQ